MNAGFARERCWMSPEPNLPLPVTYAIDYEALQRLPNAVEIALFLRQRIKDPTWSLRKTCWGCDNWTAKDAASGKASLDNYPSRPGAAAPHESCSGCWYSLLDVVGGRPSFTPIEVAQPPKRQPCRLLKDISFSTHGIVLGACE